MTPTSQKSTGQLTIQAVSIDARDEQRDAHLRSNDFLAMEEYPQITFVATDVRQTGANTLELTSESSRSHTSRGHSPRPVR